MNPQYSKFKVNLSLFMAILWFNHKHLLVSLQCWLAMSSQDHTLYIQYLVTENSHNYQNNNHGHVTDELMSRILLLNHHCTSSTSRPTNSETIITRGPVTSASITDTSSANSHPKYIVHWPQTPTEVVHIQNIKVLHHSRKNLACKVCFTGRTAQLVQTPN